MTFWENNLYICVIMGFMCLVAYLIFEALDIK